MKAELKVTYRRAEELAPHERNARTHSAAQVEQIAASMREFGWTNPVLVDEAGRVIAGHGRLAAGALLGLAEVPTICIAGLTDTQRRALVIADNKLALNAGWDDAMLASEVAALRAEDFAVDLLGFTAGELDELLPGDAGEVEADQADVIPEMQTAVVSQPGDVWLMGSHRVMCGDSCNPEDVARLMNGATAALVHADPPYGMGKAAAGVANDNLYGAKLDAFQMAWWSAFRPHLKTNGSAYVWGNAPDLWRLWYLGGLGDSEPLTLRNEIVWDKKSIPGMASEELTQYPEASERCLYFQVGRYVFQVNQTKEDYWPGWEPIRLWMCEQRDAMGWKASHVKAILENQMYGHLFTRCQWSFVSAKDYAKLQAAAGGRAFGRLYADLLAEYRAAQAIFRGEVLEPRSSEFRAGRPFFDNAHDAMRDVWEFSRVTGDDRHGHATPKPVAMMERVMRSSVPEGDVCAEPFGGSGSTLIGAERTGRACYCMELQAQYVDVTVRRWQAFTGRKAKHAASGMTFEQLSEFRLPVAA